MHEREGSSVRPRIGALSTLAAVGLVVASFGGGGCSPGACHGLMIGDELVMTVSGFSESPASECDREGLGLAIGTQLKMSVEEHRAPLGGDVVCLTSTGGLDAETGWTYERSSKRPPPLYTFETVINASKGACSGEVEIRVIVSGNGDLRSEAVSGLVAFEYRPRASVANCPVSCREDLIGTLARTR